ncbi:MAG: hypothetical protein K2X94_04315 [Amoebophilaceae bacterium]|nr:hypothetical protein [Amoebophilaceae bacterium]
MKYFNRNKSMVNKSTIATKLFVGIALAGCNHRGIHQAKENLLPPQGAVKKGIVEAFQKENQVLDELYLKIYHTKSNYYYQSNNLEAFTAFKEAATLRGVHFHHALKQCSINTGHLLSSCHLYDAINNNQFDLVAQVIYAGVVDTSLQLHGADARKELDYLVRYKREAAEVVWEALFITDQVKEIDNACINSQVNALTSYKDYAHFRSLLKDVPLPIRSTGLYNEVDGKIQGLIKNLIATASTDKEKISLCNSMYAEDLVLFRFEFELEGEEDSIPTNVLHPRVYQRLSEGGYAIARNAKDLDRIKRYLRSNCPELFNQYQPNIPAFHDAASQEDMILNQQYMDLYYAPTTEKTYTRLLSFYDYVVSKQLDFREVLKKCMANTGLKLQTYHLSHSLYRGYQHLVIDALYAGVVDIKSTQEWYIGPKKMTLRSFAKKYKSVKVIAALDAIES